MEYTYHNLILCSRIIWKALHTYAAPTKLSRNMRNCVIFIFTICLFLTEQKIEWQTRVECFKLITAGLVCDETKPDQENCRKLHFRFCAFPRNIFLLKLHFDVLEVKTELCSIEIMLRLKRIGEKWHLTLFVINSNLVVSYLFFCFCFLQKQLF